MQKPVLNMLFTLLDNTSDCVGKTIEGVYGASGDDDIIFRFTDKTAIHFEGSYGDGYISVPSFNPADGDTYVTAGLLDSYEYDKFKVRMANYNAFAATEERTRRIKSFIHFTPWAIEQALNNEAPVTAPALDAYQLLLIDRPLVEKLFNEYKESLKST